MKGMKLTSVKRTKTVKATSSPSAAKAEAMAVMKNKFKVTGMKAPKKTPGY